MTIFGNSSGLRSALANYAAAALLAAMFGFISYSSADAPGLTALKVLSAPLFLLSLGGVKSIFREPIFEAALTGRALEYSLLHAGVTAAFITLIVWTPDKSAWQVFGQFAFGLAIFGIFNGALLLLRVRELRRPGRKNPS